MNKRKVTLIAALADNNVIGNKGTLPWHLKKDFAWFVEKTLNKVVVMGRKNYDDIIKFTKGKPLKNRINVIITTKPLIAEGFIVLHSIEEVFQRFPLDELMVIGGQQIYEQFLPYAETLILTEIEKSFEGDTFFPTWDRKSYTKTFEKEETENNLHYYFRIYTKTLAE